MKLVDTEGKSASGAIVSNAANMRLRGPWLILAQVVCLLVVLLALGLFFAGVPLRFHELLTLSQQAERVVPQRLPGAERSLFQGVLSVNFYPFYVLTLEIGLMVGLVLANLLIVWQRRGDWKVLLFSISGITYVTYITRLLDVVKRTYPLWRFPVSFLQALGVGSTLIYFYLFPNGRFVPSWTKPLAIVWGIWTVLWLLFPSVPFNFSNPYILSFPWFLMFMLWWLSGIVAQLYRYRQVSKFYRRQQIRWIVFSITFSALSYAAYYLPRMLFSSLGPSGNLSVLYTAIGIPLLFSCLLFIPVSYLVSLLRYHVFDINVIINRTLVYGTLTSTLALVYLGLVIGLQTLFHWITGQVSQSSVAIVASTLVIAALFQPLRRRTQAIIDRRFYRRKYNAAKTVESFSATLRSEVDLNPLREHLLTVVEETMQPTFVSLWLRPPEHERKHWTPWRANPPLPID